MKIQRVTIGDLCDQQKCDPRTVMARIARGILPPLLGDQSGLNIRDRSWDLTYWRTWHREKARRAAEPADIGQR